MSEQGREENQAENPRCLGRLHKAWPGLCRPLKALQPMAAVTLGSSLDSPKGKLYKIPSNFNNSRNL